MTINDKYKLLFKEQTRYYILTGGRGSGKSFAVSVYLTLKLMAENVRVLFTRYTLVSAKDSIIPEFREKLEILDYTDKFSIQKQDISNIETNSDILFRGIKTSEGVQTSKLKSLTGVNIWVLDEAEELVDEQIFDKIDLSIREKTNKNIVILIMNPAYRSHWIYKRFFKNANIPEKFNGVKNNVTYIHTDYTDNWQNIDSVLLSEIRRLKKKNPARFEHEILGSWVDEPDDIVFSKNKINRFSLADLKLENALVLAHVDVADQGNDSLSAVICAVVGAKVFVLDVVHSKAGALITTQKLCSKLDKYKVEKCLVESNNQGLFYSRDLKRIILENEYYKTIIKAYPQRDNKQQRIYAQSDYVLEHFYFLLESEIPFDSEYYNFIKELTSYKLQDKENDDAPDTVAGLSKYIRIKKLLSY